jgi:AraC-like DNA-binding protein
MARRDPRNVSKYWWYRHLPGVSLIHADFTSHDYAPHSHDATVIAVTELGGADISSRRTSETARPATLFVSNPHELQSSRMGRSERWRYRAMYLSQAAVDMVMRELGIETPPHFARSMVDDPALARGFGWLHRTLEADHDRVAEEELLVGTIGTLFQRYGGGHRMAVAPRDRVLLDKVVALMRAEYSRGLRLSTLASAAELTSFQLIGLFKRTVGLTPHAYLVQVRLDMACRLLTRGYPPAQAAMDAGFCDQSALTRHLKRCYGITPQQFAEAARAGR